MNNDQLDSGNKEHWESTIAPQQFKSPNSTKRNSPVVFQAVAAIQFAIDLSDEVRPKLENMVSMYKEKLTVEVDDDFGDFEWDCDYAHEKSQITSRDTMSTWLFSHQCVAEYASAWLLYTTFHWLQSELRDGTIWFSPTFLCDAQSLAGDLQTEAEQAIRHIEHTSSPTQIEEELQVIERASTAYSVVGVLQALRAAKALAELANIEEKLIALQMTLPTANFQPEQQEKPVANLLPMLVVHENKLKTL